MNMRLLGIAGLCIALAACDTGPAQNATSASGVAKANVKVQTESDGTTVEQRSYSERV